VTTRHQPRRSRPALHDPVCPTCGNRPTNKHELQLHREALETVWLASDPSQPGLVSERWHCEQCQPHRADVVMCPCGNSVMLSEDLVGQPGAVPVIAGRWLRDHGWTQSVTSWRCHQHPAPSGT
jgi:hypothetical protein